MMRHEDDIDGRRRAVSAMTGWLGRVRARHDEGAWRRDMMKPPPIRRPCVAPDAQLSYHDNLGAMTCAASYLKWLDFVRGDAGQA